MNLTTAALLAARLALYWLALWLGGFIVLAILVVVLTAVNNTLTAYVGEKGLAVRATKDSKTGKWTLIYGTRQAVGELFAYLLVGKDVQKIWKSGSS